MSLLFEDLPRASKSYWPWVATDKYSETPADPGTVPPKLSVVTPSYNQGQFLEETIRSVLLQGYPNLEYIIMDGGSTDNSVDIIGKYEPWLRHWESKPDRGQSHAINKAFDCCSGEIMAWLNSDDVLAPGALRTVAELLRGRRMALLVGASVITEMESKLDGQLDRRRPSWPEVLYDFQSFPQPSVFWTRDLWQAVGPLDEDLYYVMDYDLWLRMYPYVQHMVFSEEVLSYARTHDGQKSAGTGGGVFHQQRAYVAVRAAKMRGEHPLLWIGRSWGRRFWQACRCRNRSLLKGSATHRAALRSAWQAL